MTRIKELDKINKILKELDDAYKYAEIATKTWQGTDPVYDTREEWLNAMLDLLRPHFDNQGYHINGNLRLSCGFPRGRKVIVGQCWSETLSKDGTVEIFISPTIDDPIEATSILIHELVHATVGVSEGHNKVFKRCAVLVGLMGKMTATIPSPELIRNIADMFDRIGRYPHAVLRDLTYKKQSTRLVKCVCPQCGFTARITRKWLDDVGCPVCRKCNVSLEETTKERG